MDRTFTELVKIGDREISVYSTSKNSMVLNGDAIGISLADIYKTTDYIPFDHYNRFGTLSLGKPTAWKQGKFYHALKDMGIICIDNRIKYPCSVLAEMKKEDGHIYQAGDTEHKVDTKINDKGETVEKISFFNKKVNGRWGFRFSTLGDFIRLHGDEIHKRVSKMEEDEATVEAEKNAIRKLAKYLGVTQKELKSRYLSPLATANDLNMLIEAKNELEL